MKAVALVIALLVLSACDEASNRQYEAEYDDYCRGAFAVAHTAQDSARIIAERVGWSGKDGSWCGRLVARELHKATR